MTDDMGVYPVMYLIEGQMAPEAGGSLPSLPERLISGWRLKTGVGPFKLVILKCLRSYDSIKVEGIQTFYGMFFMHSTQPVIST